jgi:hypothetical protein
VQETSKKYNQIENWISCYVITTCTHSNDSSSRTPISAEVSKVKVQIIKELFEKGYEVKSDSIFI